MTGRDASAGTLGVDRKRGMMGLVCLLVLLSLGAGCGAGDRERSYMWEGEDGVSFLRWTEDSDGRLSGSWETVYQEDGLREDGFDFTGTLEGSGVTIEHSSPHRPSPWSGMIEGKEMKLSMIREGEPYEWTMAEATSQGYAEAAARVREDAALQAAQKADTGETETSEQETTETSPEELRQRLKEATQDVTYESGGNFGGLLSAEGPIANAEQDLAMFTGCNFLPRKTTLLDPNLNATGLLEFDKRNFYERLAEYEGARGDLVEAIEEARGALTDELGQALIDEATDALEEADAPVEAEKVDMEGLDQRAEALVAAQLAAREERGCDE